ncbi:MAG TPA: hypothetical protein VGK92_01580 [Gaiellales bacterium]|jgi:hypothetical protein
MHTSLRTLTCALAVASAVAAAPAAANPGLQRVHGGPGASASLRGGVLTMRWTGGSSRVRVPAGYALPAVTTRGALGGLSYSGQTAVLAGRYAGGRSHFLIAEFGTLTPLALAGRVTFDAISPDGSSVYVTRRASTTDPTRYTVLSYSRSEHALTAVTTKVVFSAEGNERPDGWQMQGVALARSTAAAGDWVYTLYRSREYPFIHALPVGLGAWAVCIELPESWRARVGTLRLRAGAGRTVSVLSATGAVLATANVTTGTLALTART